MNKKEILKATKELVAHAELRNPSWEISEGELIEIAPLKFVFKYHYTMETFMGTSEGYRLANAVETEEGWRLTNWDMDLQ